MEKYTVKSQKKHIRMWAVVLLNIILITAGVLMMAYPIIASQYAESVRSEVRTEYEEVLQEADTTKLDAVRAAAEAYNHAFFSGQVDLMNPGASGYWEQLLLDGIDCMGYISIQKLGIQLPIYHGIGAEALSRGCGHMPQSSLPIGGVNTHAVISAHTGSSSGSLFSDLDKLEVGDIFQLEILGETLTYEIQSANDIQVVLPEAVNNIKIQTGKDLVTLVTCTPYGINTHRLLVTGHRIENPAEETESSEPVEIVPTTPDDTTSNWLNNYKSSVIAALFIIDLSIFLCVAMTVSQRRRKNSIFTDGASERENG